LLYGEQVTRERLLTPAYAMLCLAYFGVYIDFYTLGATIVSYVVDEFGASQAIAGAVAAAFSLGSTSARLVSGRLIDALGMRNVVVWSLVLHLVAALLYPLTPTTDLTIAVRFVHGIAMGVSTTAIAGAAVANAPASRRGEASGWVTGGGAVATGLGPLIALRLADAPIGQTGVFTVAVVAAGIALLASVVARKGLGETHPARSRRERGFISRPALPVAAVVALCAFPFAVILAYLAEFSESAGLAQPATVYFLVYAIAEVIGRPSVGLLQDRMDDRAVLAPMMAFLVVGAILTARATSATMLLAGALLLGLGYGTLVTAGQTVAINRTGADRAGLALGSYFLLVDLGTGLGPLILGLLIDPLGYRNTFMVGAGCGVLALVLSFVLGLVPTRHSPGATIPVTRT